MKNSQNLSFIAFSFIGAAWLTGEYQWGMNEFISILMAFYFGLSLTRNLGKKLPFKELVSFIYIIQILVGALVTYKFYPTIPIGYMSVSEETYYGYTLPCVILFILGLYLPIFKHHTIDVKRVLSLHKEKESWLRFGLFLIFFSFLSDVISYFFYIESLNFVFVLIYYFKFVGLYYIWMANYRFRRIFLLVILLPFASKSLGGGLFIELFIWGFMTFAVFQLKNSWSFKRNLLAFVSGIFLIFVLQSVKIDFRKQTWSSSQELSIWDRLSILSDLITTVDLNDKQKRDVANSRFIVRINQGFIVSMVLRNMPQRVDFVDGEYFKKELVGVLVPRFLNPDKAVVNDHEKFEKFAGWRLDKKVAMAVSILGDGYGNFGYWGGILFCFLNGLFLNFLLHLCVKLAKKYEVSLIFWMPLIFAFSMRCGDEFYIITNHIVKSSILIFIVLYIAKRVGTLSKRAEDGYNLMKIKQRRLTLKF